MTDEEKKKRQDEFWDISRLTPRRAPTAPRFSQVPAMPEVTVPAPAAASADAPPREERTLTPPPPTEEEVTTYRPEGNPLILSVTVRRTLRGYSFFEQFRRDAHRYFDVEGTPCDYTPFFSFSPQYSQLTPAQRAYYFYLRTEIRRGNFPRADKGYFFLLVYEIINLPDLIPPADGARLLAALWGGYRDTLSGIDRYLSAWLLDYCLVFQLACPDNLTPACLSVASAGEGMEFFFGNAGDGTEEGTLRFLRLASPYSFEASRAITDENRAAFTHHMLGAMAAVLPAVLAEAGERREVVTLRRRAFSGSMCSHNLRAELAVEYISLRGTEHMRKTLGLCVKYAENCLRAALSVRARLSVVGLGEAYRALIDAYFAAASAALARRRPQPPPPAYERLYDAPTEGIDRGSAAEIEATSWALTRRLVSEEDEIAPLTFGEDAPPPPPAAPIETPQDPPAPSGDRRDLSLLVSAYLEGGTAPARAAASLGLPLALLAERINEEFIAVIGDVLLEPAGDGFVLIEDYREEAEEWLKKQNA